jgi:hypothetical protein
VLLGVLAALVIKFSGGGESSGEAVTAVAEE